MIQRSVSLEYKPSSEPLHVSVKKLHLIPTPPKNRYVSPEKGENKKMDELKLEEITILVMPRVDPSPGPLPSDEGTP